MTTKPKKIKKPRVQQGKIKKPMSPKGKIPKKREFAIGPPENPRVISTRE